MPILIMTKNKGLLQNEKCHSEQPCHHEQSCHSESKFSKAEL